MKFCQNCGKKIPASAKFCTYCGAEQTVMKQNQQAGNREQPSPERTQSRTYGNVNDEDYWYTHGFFTSIIQCDWAYRFMWSSLLGLVVAVVFLMLGFRYGGQNQSVFISMLIIGLVVGFIIFILPLNRRFLISVNRKLTLNCYRYMHRRHPEYSIGDVDQIVNYRIKKLDSMAWKVFTVLMCLAFVYIAFVAIFCLAIIVLVGSIFFGTRSWHLTSSHWY